MHTAKLVSIRPRVVTVHVLYLPVYVLYLTAVNNYSIEGAANNIHSLQAAQNFLAEDITGLGS